MNFITKTDAIEILGITPAQFLKLNIASTKVARNPYNKRGKMYLYEESAIDSINGSTAIIQLRQARKEKLPKDYEAIFSKRRYDKDTAVQLAAKYMFSLNRYTKNRRCSASNVDEIYCIKNSFIEYLYKNEYCVDIKIHEQLRYSKEEDIEYKYRYYCFSFLINDEKYCWHQPEEDVHFQIDLTRYEREVMPQIEQDKEIPLKKGLFKEAKEFVKWVIKNF